MSPLAVAQPWTVYLAFDLGSIGGDLFSNRPIKRGMASIRARLTAS